VSGKTDIEGYRCGGVMAIRNDFDFTIVLIVNKFVGKSGLLDASVELISDKFIFHGVLFVALFGLYGSMISATNLEFVCSWGVLQPFCWGF
jgi:hypothetical protein